MIMISNFLFIFFVLFLVFLTKLLTLANLFSTVVRAAVAAKLVLLGISTMTSFILALREGLAAKLVMSGTLSSIFLP